MLLFTFSGTEVLLGLGGLCLAVGGAIFLLRFRLRAAKEEARYAAFSFTTPLHRLSLCVAIAAAVLCLNWTQYDPQETVYLVGDFEDDIIEMDIPITKTPPPPPPPPPPPSVIVAPDEAVVDTVSFIDLSITDDEPVIAPPPVIVPAAAPLPPPPPPPPPPVDDNEPIIFAERMPVFGQECFELDGDERKMCSDRALLGFVQSRANYPALARENGIEGTVVISFTVEKDGTVTDVIPARKVGGGCTESALKAVNAINLEGQRFLPGRQGGQLVRVRYNLPVKFKLEQ